MALTSNFDETVVLRAQKSKKFRNLLLENAINELISGDFKLAKILLRQYVNAVISFSELANESKIHDKSIQRMLSGNGNPTTTSLLSLLRAIQKIEGIRLKTKVY